jgi:hypothetical protein
MSRGDQYEESGASMTYPPQQPGPYGQDPYGQQPPQGPYGQQPDQFGGQPAYQGFGGYPGPDGGFPGGQPPQPPKPRNTGKIVAIVAIAVLVLGGGGVGAYFLLKDDKSPSGASGTTSAPKTTESSSSSKTSQSKPSESADPSESETPTTRPKTSSSSGSDDSSGSDSPEAIVDAYIDAYVSKSFSSVTSDACDAYKKKYGTDTSELESTLSDYEITGKPKGTPTIKGSTATAEIDLTLVKSGTSKEASIRIKIVKEDGSWKFCGEEAA